ncbi:MAG: hypothetical protein GX273_10010 [Bacteroidales bacterium]|nr:hypothetical protein [Bacteroidales bacterium]
MKKSKNNLQVRKVRLWSYRVRILARCDPASRCGENQAHSIGIIIMPILVLFLCGKLYSLVGAKVMLNSSQIGGNFIMKQYTKKLTKTEMLMKICVGLEVIAAVHGMIHFLNMDMHILLRIIGIILATDVILGSFHVFYIPENEDINEYKKSKIKPSTCLVLIIASLLLAILGIVLPLKIAIAIVVNAFFIILGLNVIRKIKEMF